MLTQCVMCSRAIEVQAVYRIMSREYVTAAPVQCGRCGAWASGKLTAESDHEKRSGLLPEGYRLVWHARKAAQP